jgi:hypothetical protein
MAHKPTRWLNPECIGAEFDLPKYAMVEIDGLDFMHIGNGRFVCESPPSLIEMLVPNGEPEQPNQYQIQQKSLRFVTERGNPSLQISYPSLIE